jgi:hypothetical protein
MHGYIADVVCTVLHVRFLRKLHSSTWHAAVCVEAAVVHVQQQSLFFAVAKQLKTVKQLKQFSHLFIWPGVS